MNMHPEADELQSFRQRRLPAAAMLRIDQHLADCAHCRALLSASSVTAARAARRVLGAVVAAGPHLSFEQIEGLVDQRLAGSAMVSAQAHVDQCVLCRREVDELRQHAPALRQALAPRAATAPTAWWASLLRLGPALALASVVGAVALTVFVQETKQGGSGVESLQTPQGSAPAAGFDHSALAQLDAVSAAAASAWREKNYAQLVALLKPLGERSQPLALSALASLYAQGLGVTQDWRMAEQLWQRAAALGQPGAKENLLALRQRGA